MDYEIDGKNVNQSLPKVGEPWKYIINPLGIDAKEVFVRVRDYVGATYYKHKSRTYFYSISLWTYEMHYTLIENCIPNIIRLKPEKHIKFIPA